MSWKLATLNRSTWRGLINKGTKRPEVKRAAEAERKRRQRKKRAASTFTDSQPQIWPVIVCGRHFRAWIGLSSHLRTHPSRTHPSPT